MTDLTQHTHARDETMASLPYPLQRKTPFDMLKQFVIIIRIMLSEYRRIWIMNVLMGFLIPFGFLFFLKSFSGTINNSHALFLLGGNMATSIALGPMSFLILKMGWARQSREFDYWIALPLPKLAVVFAIITVALLFALPGLVSVYIFGSILFDLPFTNFLVLLPLIPLSILPLAGLGALIGIQASSGQVASMLSNFLIVFISLFSPMMIPFEALPLPFRIISRVIPTTYVADAFRAVLSGKLDTNFMLDISILAIFAILFLSIAYVRLDWRTAS